MTELEKALNEAINHVESQYKKIRKTIKAKVNFLSILRYAKSGGTMSKINFLKRCGVNIDLDVKVSYPEALNFNFNAEKKD